MLVYLSMFFGLRKILKGPTGFLDGTVERCNDTMKMTTKFLFHFKDCAVYSLNVTGAFADSIICP